MVDTYFDITSTTTNIDIKFDIYNILKRTAKNLYVVNDGSYDMFIKLCTNMKSPKKAYTLSGYWIPHGKIGCFHNVYEIIVAKSAFRNQYRITEFEFIDQRQRHKSL